MARVRGAAGARPFDPGTVLTTERLSLTPLREDDAGKMVSVLGDERLHEFIGGHPTTLPELRDRFARLAAGSPNRDERWLNWIVRRRADHHPVGTVQATVIERDGRISAFAAWVIGVDWQRKGFASEAVRALVAWLVDQGADEVVAHIQAGHRASEIVAARAGLEATGEEAGGERVWRLRPVSA